MASKRRKKRSKHVGVKVIRRGEHWAARWTDPITGREQQVGMRSLGLDTAEAREQWAIEKLKALQKLRAQLAITGTAETLPVPLADAVREYLATFGKPNTVNSKRAPLGVMVAFLEGQGVKVVQDITGPNLTALGEHLRRPASPFAPRTKKQQLGVVRAWANRERNKLARMPRVPAGVIETVLRPGKLPKEPIEVLQPGDVRKLLRAVVAHDADHPGEAVAAFTLLLLLTGMRFTELFEMQWREVDRDAGEILLAAARTKTEDARTVTLNETPTALRLLAVMALRGTTGKVWPTATRTMLEKVRARLTREYDAPTYTWHMLRRTCGSGLVCGGVLGHATPFLTAKRLGHSLQVAEKSYLDVFKNLPRDATTLEHALGITDEADAVVQAEAMRVGARAPGARKRGRA